MHRSGGPRDRLLRFWLLKPTHRAHFFPLRQHRLDYPGQLNMRIRLAERTDQPQIVRLIADIFREYGETICLDNCDSDLLDLERNFQALGGSFWVLEEQGKIKGTVAVTPSHEPSADPIIPCLLKRLYLHPSLRGGVWGRELMQTAVEWARQQGFQRMEFWSDSRFSRAHNFYQKFGCLMTGQSRVMHDSYEPYEEYHFRLDLAPVARRQVAE